MCRIESPALQEIESRGAAERQAATEERLVSAVERITAHAARRRGKSIPVFTDETRERIIKSIRRLAKLA